MDQPRIGKDDLRGGQVASRVRAQASGGREDSVNDCPFGASGGARKTHSTSQRLQRLATEENMAG